MWNNFITGFGFGVKLLGFFVSLSVVGSVLSLFTALINRATAFLKVEEEAHA